MANCPTKCSIVTGECFGMVVDRTSAGDAATRALCGYFRPSREDPLLSTTDGEKFHGRAEGVHHRAGRSLNAGCGDLLEGWDQSGDLLQLEEDVYWFASDRDEAAQAARGRECPAEEDRGGPDFASGNTAGRDPAKALKPCRMRELVRVMCSDWAVSIRQACGATGFDRWTFHYQSCIRP